MMKFPTEWKIIKTMLQTTNQNIISYDIIWYVMIYDMMIMCIYTIYIYHVLQHDLIHKTEQMHVGLFCFSRCQPAVVDDSYLGWRFPQISTRDGMQPTISWLLLLPKPDLETKKREQLVVSTSLKNISQLGWFFPIYGKIKNVPSQKISGNGHLLLEGLVEFWWNQTVS